MDPFIVRSCLSCDRKYTGFFNENLCTLCDERSCVVCMKSFKKLKTFSRDKQVSLKVMKDGLITEGRRVMKSSLCYDCE